jgi:hypothetical protein
LGPASGDVRNRSRRIRQPSSESRGSLGAAWLSRRFAGPSVGERGKLFGVRFEVDVVGIEAAADPFGQLGVTLVLGVGDRLEESG